MSLRTGSGLLPPSASPMIWSLGFVCFRLRCTLEPSKAGEAAPRGGGGGRRRGEAESGPPEPRVAGRSALLTLALCLPWLQSRPADRGQGAGLSFLPTGSTPWHSGPGRCLICHGPGRCLPIRIRGGRVALSRGAATSDSAQVFVS